MGYPGPAQSSRGRALPIVVATGLAIGVFVGLIVVRGLGEKAEGEAQAAAKTTDSEQAASAGGDRQVATATADAGATASATTDAGAAAPTGDAADSVQAATTAADAGGTGEATTPTELVVKATLTFETIPRTAELLVDEQELPGRVYTVTLDDGKALVKVEASAEGYRDYDKIFKVNGDKTIRVALRKRRSGGGGKGGRGGGKGGRGGPGGLIDL